MPSAYRELNDVECGSSAPQQEHARRRKIRIATFSAVSCLLIGAAILLRSTKQPTKNANERPAEDDAVSKHRYGGDRDSHGCIHSAGYSWCEKKAECIRPWEHGITSPAVLVATCGETGAVSSAPVALEGGDRDQHGCIRSAGFEWCGKESTCIRRWEHGIHDDATMTAKCGGLADLSGEQMYQCNCPPSEAVYSCTAKEHNALLSGTTCPYYASQRPAQKQSYQCNCPPSEAIYPCTAEERQALLSGTTCPYYASQRPAKKQSYQCNCPPSEAIYPCTAEERQALLSGVTCPYYVHMPSSGVACTVCNGGETSLQCRACQNGMTASSFCKSCVTQGLNDIGCNNCPTATAAAEQQYDCNCPPQEVIYPCTADEQRALLNGTACPYYASHRPAREQSHQCNCPPSQAIYPCTAEEHRALLSGTTCPYYASGHGR